MSDDPRYMDTRDVLISLETFTEMVTALNPDEVWLTDYSGQMALVMLVGRIDGTFKRLNLIAKECDK